MYSNEPNYREEPSNSVESRSFREVPNVESSHFLDPRRQGGFRASVAANAASTAKATRTVRASSGLPRRPPLQARPGNFPENTENTERTETGENATPKTSVVRSRLPTPAQVAPGSRRPAPVRLVQETDADGVPVFKAAVEPRPASTLDGVRVERVRLM